MKTQLFKILHISITMLFLAACSDSQQPEILDDTPDVPIDITVSRSTTTQDETNALATKFTPGCLLGISVNGRSEYLNMKYRYPADGTTLEPTNGTIYCGAQSTIEAYYPYRADGDYTHAYVQHEQTSENSYYGSDALSATGTLNGNKVLNLRFEHRMAKVVFKLNQKIEHLNILNQSLSTKATTGSETIYAHRENETYKEFSAFIVPGQTKLEIKIGVRLVEFVWDYFTATFDIPDPIVAGRQYTFKIDKLRRRPNGEAWMIIDNEDIEINDNDTYWITKKGIYVPTEKSIIIKGSSPTVHLVGLDMESYQPIQVKAGNPTFIIEGENKITSTGQGRTAIGGEAGCPIVIRGGNNNPKLIAKGGEGGAAIGSGQGGGCGDITIENCYVKAEATRKENIIQCTGGAGIGSAWRSGCGNINITNATIEAKGVGGAAAIGSGREGTCGNITIKNSSITASADGFFETFPSIIGSGGGRFDMSGNMYFAKCGNISITLKSGQNKDDFLSKLTPLDDRTQKVGIGTKYSECGTINWYNAIGNVIE